MQGKNVVPPLADVLGRRAVPGRPVGKMGHRLLDPREHRAAFAVVQRLAQRRRRDLGHRGRRIEHRPAQQVGVAIEEFEVGEFLGMMLDEPRMVAGGNAGSGPRAAAARCASRARWNSPAAARSQARGPPAGTRRPVGLPLPGSPRPDGGRRRSGVNRPGSDRPGPGRPAAGATRVRKRSRRSWR